MKTVFYFLVNYRYFCFVKYISPKYKWADFNILVWLTFWYWRYFIKCPDVLVELTLIFIILLRFKCKIWENLFQSFNIHDKLYKVTEGQIRTCKGFIVIYIYLSNKYLLRFGRGDVNSTFFFLTASHCILHFTHRDSFNYFNTSRYDLFPYCRWRNEALRM